MVDSSRSTAISEPVIAPAMVGTISHMAPSKTSFLDARYVASPTPLCSKTPIRFVPFATGAGRPQINTKMGRVISDPLPASVLIMPVTTPATKNRAHSQAVRSMLQISGGIIEEKINVELLILRHGAVYCAPNTQWIPIL